jgi:hypothetical protein
MFRGGGDRGLPSDCLVISKLSAYISGSVPDIYIPTSSSWGIASGYHMPVEPLHGMSEELLRFNRFNYLRN